VGQADDLHALAVQVPTEARHELGVPVAEQEPGAEGASNSGQDGAR
jgi:hypothetical protein